MRNRKRFGAILLCALLACADVAAAQTDIGWVGPTGGGWSVAQNWNPQTIPHNVGTMTYTATVNANGPVVDGGFTILGLNLNDQILLGSSSNLGFGTGTLTGNTFINGNGSINIAPGAMTAPTSLVLQGGTTLTLSGNGVILMGGLGTARIVGGPTSTFNNANWRIVGEGNLLEGFVRLVNNGTITASGGSLVLNAAGYTNDRLLSALAGATMRINGSFGTMTNNGTILADGGIVNLAQGLHIDGGTLTTSNGGVIATATGGVSTIRLSGVTNAGAFLSLGGTNTDIDTMFTNRGTFTIETGGHLRVIGAATLTGSGTIVMQPLSEIVRSGTGSATLVNLTNTIRGNGQIAGIELVNELDGKILVDGGASLLIQHSSRGMRNAGLIRVGSPDDLTHGTLVFSGFNGGSFNNTEATIQLYTSGSRLRLIDGAVIAGGQITSFGFGESQVIVPAGHVAALNRVNVFGTRVDVQGILRVAHSIDGNGVFEIRAGAAVHVDGSATFGFGHNWSMNTTSIFRSAPGSGDDAEGATAELFNDGVIAGAGNLGVNTLRITNDGTITANAGTAQTPLLMTVDPSPEGLLNAGVMESDDFGVLLLSGAGGGSFTQQGTALIRALGANSNVRLGGTTSFNLSGGQFGSGAGSIAVDGGTTATLADLTSDALLTTGLGIGTILINNNVVNNGTVSLPFSGRLVVAGASTLNSASGYIQSNGSITINNNGNLDANFIAGTGSALVQGGGTLRAHSIRQGRLTIDNGGFAHLKSAFTGSVDPSRVGSLTIGAAPAFLDVANRVLIIDQSGTIALNTLRNHIVNAYNAGAWDGPGIRSSVAAANPGHGVGYGEASAVFTSFPATYFGQTIDNTTLLVTYTRYGDANLDRQVNLQDFNRLASNFGQSNKLWTDGDFTYDGLVSLADFNRLASNFGLGAVGPEVTPIDWAALAAAVPEPMLPTVFALALIGMLRRPRGAAWCAAWCAVLCTLVLASQPLFAQTPVTYIGPAGDIWHNPMNWMPQVIPDNDTNATNPIFYTVLIDRPVTIDGFLFDIAGMTNGSDVTTKTSWDLRAGIGSGAPFLHNNSGNFIIAPDGPVSNNAVIGLETGQQLMVDGGGIIRLGGAGTARIRGGGTLINQNNTIRGEGSIGEGSLAIHNGGAILATADDLGGVGTLLVYPHPTEGLYNNNLMAALDGGNLVLRGFYSNFGGTIGAENGGTVHMSNSPFIRGGTITTSANGTIIVANQQATWETLTHSGRATVNSSLLLYGGIAAGAVTNTGSITLNGQLRINNLSALLGSGTIFMNGGTINSFGGTPTLFTNRNYITGRGFVGDGIMTIANEFTGVIRANGGSLVIHAPTGVNFSFNSATFMADGGTLVLRGGRYLSASGHFLANNSVVRLESPVIDSGTFISSGTGEFHVPLGETAFLAGRMHIDGRVVDAGGLDLSGVYVGATTFELQGTRLSCIGTVSFFENVYTFMRPGARIGAGAGSMTTGTFSNAGTITGSGTIGLNQLQVNNSGTISVSGGSVTLAIDPGPVGMTNTGTIEATGNGSILLTGNGGGSFTQGGGSFNEGGGGGVIRAVDPGSNVHLFNNAQLSGGQLGAGAGSITAAFGTIMLEDVTNNANFALLGVATLVTSGNVVNNGTMSTGSNGRLIVNGSLSLGAGGAGHFASNGSLIINGGGQLDANVIEGNGTVTVQTGGLLRAHVIRQNRLTIADGASVQLKHATPGSGDPCRLGTLTIGAAPALLDVTNRVLILDQSGTDPLNALRAQIVSGYNAGTWDGPGIHSSDAATSPGHGVGYGEANAVFSTFPATYFGQTVDNTTLLVTYTKYGDANLDRAVNLNDFNRLAANFGQTNRLWTHGDSTYDGLVNLDDFNRMAANFGLTAAGPEVTPQDWAMLAASVPEPTAASAIAAACGLLVRLREVFRTSR